VLLAGTKGSRPIYIERLFCSSSISSRPRHPPSSSSSCRAAVVVYPHPAAPFSRPASRRIPSPPLHPIPPSVAEASRAPTAVELDLYCALDRLPSSSLARPASSTVVEPRPPGLVVELARPPGLTAVVDYNVGFFIVFLDNTDKQYLVVI